MAATVSEHDWAGRPWSDAVTALGVDPALGLTEEAVAQRRADYGPNELAVEQGRGIAALVIAEFRNPLIYLLVAAGVVSLMVGEPLDAVVIGAILVLNAVLGAVQGYRADRALAELRHLTAPRATVLRDGRRGSIPAAELVPGDVVLLTAGDGVTADARLLEAESLLVAEAVLTGESLPVRKSTAAVVTTGGGQVPVADRSCLVFRGTDVVAGRGVGLVVATGMATQLGQIAGMVVAAENTSTPLQRRLAQLGRWITAVVVAICALVFVLGMLRGEDALQVLLTSVSLAVAAVPEALPAVVAITLALGASAMARRNALAKNLPSVESLGSVTHICSDKTGTLTRNRMRVAEHWLAPGMSMEELARVLARCNDATIGPEESGDPTEVALLEFAGTDWPGWTRVAEVPFDSDRMRMSTVDQFGDDWWIQCKGAPEAVLPLCREPADAEQQARDMATRGLRVLVAARRRSAIRPPESTAAELERDLELVGLVGMLDPPRKEAAAAVAECSSAGIVPVMITGDHPATAAAIAGRVGIPGSPDRVMTGAELGSIGDDDLAGRVGTTSVYARVDPAQKIRIVRALQGRGQVVAMTGDGVNDAPALKQADIGVAMGEGGTDVARGAADLILLDNNFATIVAAVAEGRRIYDNIRRFVRYVLTGNVGEITAIVAAPLLGLPLPLLPLQILWVNLLTDGLPGLALAREPAEPDTMRRAPRPPRQSVFADGMGAHVVWVGLLIGALTLTALVVGLGVGGDVGRTMAFTTLVSCQIVLCYAIRSERQSVLSTPVFGNPGLLLALVVTAALQGLVVYLPILQHVFGTTPLSAGELAVCGALSLVVLLAVEVETQVRFRLRNRLQSDDAAVSIQQIPRV